MSRRATTRAAHVHVRHDRRAEGRSADAREHAATRVAPSSRIRRCRPPTACCRRCRSTTSTASASRRSRRWCPGGSIVLPQRFSTSQWWSLVERYRPTWLNLVPTIVAYLLNGPDLTPAQREAARGVRYARSASAPLPPEQQRAFEARFGIPIVEAMGLTECASVAFCNPMEPARAPHRQRRAAARRRGARRRSARARAGRRRARRDPGARAERHGRLLPRAPTRRAVR